MGWPEHCLTTRHDRLTTPKYVITDQNAEVYDDRCPLDGRGVCGARVPCHGGADMGARPVSSPNAPAGCGKPVCLSSKCIRASLALSCQVNRRADGRHCVIRMQQQQVQIPSPRLRIGQPEACILPFSAFRGLLGSLRLRSQASRRVPCLIAATRWSVQLHKLCVRIHKIQSHIA